jgi:F0F1-type ATP synthase membrane subunit b/b'
MSGSKDDLEARVEAAQRLLREMEAALARTKQLIEEARQLLEEARDESGSAGE